VNKIFWYAERYGRTMYAINKTGKRITMHGFIMGKRDGLILDHKDGDGLNNQKSNLRFCTQSQNTQNKRSHGVSN
jgi:hypothetical protein